MPTSKALRQAATIARTKSARFLAYAETLDRAADVLESLRSRDGYARVTGMESTTATPPDKKHRGPEAMKGPVKDLAELYGYPTLQAVATALGERPSTVRMWNHREKIPAHVREKIEALRSPKK